MAGTQKTLVMKFGGTSVGDAAAVRQAVAIIATAHHEWSRLVVVTSAMAGVTDRLLDSAQSAAAGDRLKFTQAAQDLRTQHFSVLDELISDLALQSRVKQDLQHLLSDFLNLCQAIAVLGEATPRALDAVSSLGERMAVRVLSAVAENAALPAQFIEATELIATDDCYQNAH
ncbi:MAG: aspartate kinase, partial [Anaerolineae bacterium]|nr:aspartate kinase [Anaerolineae bacterium]